MTYIDILNGKGKLVLAEMKTKTVKGKKLKVHKAKEIKLCQTLWILERLTFFKIIQLKGGVAMILHTTTVGEKWSPILFLHTGLLTGMLDFVYQRNYFKEHNYQVILPD